MNKSIRFGLVPVMLALAGMLRAADDAAPAQPPEDMASVRADNKQLTEELAASWKETAALKADLAAAQAAASKNADANADLQKQLSSAHASIPDAPAADPNQLADLQEKLATALRSFTVLEDEESQLKASLDKANSDNGSLTQQLESARASNASLQAQAASTALIEPLRNELRQAEDELSRLAAENALLRTHLALQSPGPGSSGMVPLRPGQAAATAAEATPPPAPAAAPAKTYVVLEGDTLTKISRKFYGTSGRWQDILSANHDVLKDEKSLVVGSTLKIP